MQVGQAYAGFPSVRSPLSAAALEKDDKKKKKPPEEDEDPKEKWARRIGNAANTIARIPKALLFIPSFLKFAIFDTLIPLIGLTATMGGVVGTVALGAAGVLETVDGIKKKDPASVLSGLGEVARGGYAGALTWNSLQTGQLTPGGVGIACGLIHGGLNLSSGLVKMHRGIRDGNREDKIVGMLEAGMGAAAFATLAVPGPFQVPALVANGALASVRTIYQHREALNDWRINHKRKLHDLWEKFKDIFREEKKTEHAGP